MMRRAASLLYSERLSTTRTSSAQSSSSLHSLVRSPRSAASRTWFGSLRRSLSRRTEDVAIISPYYNVGPKGEANHLKKYGIEYDRSIDVYAPDKYEIGIHYGVVDGAGSFRATPYPTGPIFYTISYSSSLLRSPSSFSLGISASASYVKEKVSSRY